MKNFKVRSVSPSEEATYRSRSEDCWSLAMKAFEEKKLSGCAINIIHSVIALADLMCIRFSGKRYAGTSHDEAVDFYAKLPIEEAEFKKSIHRLGQIVSLKTHAEYGGTPMSESDISHMVKSAERFRSYILGKLGKK